MKNIEDMEKNSLCICIPTYNRSLVIQDFFDNCASYYLEAGIDIYIYDSSTNDETEYVVKNWEKRVPKRVHYIRMPSDLHSNMKVFKIWQFYGMQKKYDFIWMSGDAIQHSEDNIHRIMQALKPEYDLIELDSRDYERTTIKEYTDYNIFLREAAWQITLFGSTILNTRTILSQVDWSMYEEKYNQPLLVNFSHVSFYYKRLAEMPSFRCLHLPIKVKASPYKKQSGWHKDLFFAMCDAWVYTIDVLPECYTTKDEAIKQHGKKTLFRDEMLFWKYRKEGLYGLKVFFKYFFVWKRVCDISRKKLLLLAGLPEPNYTKWLIKNKNKQMRKFVDKYEDVYLYGAGIVGQRYGKYLTGCRIGYKGYVVTKRSENQKEVNGHPVVEIAQLKKNNKIGILIAVSDELLSEIMDMLKNYGYMGQVFFSKELFEWIWFYMKESE